MRIADWMSSIMRRRSQQRGRARPRREAGLSRRDLALVAAGVFLPGLAPAEAEAARREGLAVLRRAQLATMIRALADLSRHHDPVLDDMAGGLLARIEEFMPEARTLYRIHSHFPPVGGGVLRPPGHGIDLALLHQACHDARPVAFDYTDLEGRRTSRRVLPLELVHPRHGIQLLAHCELRGAQRKFFVHEIRNLTLREGDFSDRRPQLLQAALEQLEDRQREFYLNG